MKRMLFNATHAEETRVGIVDGQKLIDIDIETVGREARKSNIYRGVVTRIEPSLEACFVNYGEERHGFLPFKEISRSYFKEGVDVRSTTIREAISEGQELIVQVEKEERGNKGAALTTFISLAGRYLVLMPNNPRGGGVSRRIEGEERQELREAMDKLELPRGMSTIARTAGIGRTTEELQWDLNYLLKLWTAISEAAEPQYELVKNDNGRRTATTVNTPVVDGKPLKRINPPPYLIVEESNLVVRAIRDYFQDDIGEILVDTDDIYDQARQFMAHVMPDMVNRVKRYREDIPLFTRFQIEHQIETAYSRTVPLPSGGAIVIDHTEALVAIDVNSARATRGADIEETAFRTNCEAADEVARQMRLRDLGGLIVIDFIDMADSRNQRAVEQRLKDAMRYDRARVQMAKISRFGLMELSRQRLRPALSEGNHITCPRCNGVGVIRDTESCALQVLRILQEEAMKEGTGAVHAQVPVDVATFLLNEKRNDVMKLEARHRVPIVLIPNMHLETPHYHIERLRQDDDRLEDTTASFKRVEDIEEAKADDPYALKSNEDKPLRPKQVPVIKNVITRDPAPVHVEAEKPVVETSSAEEPAKKGFFARLIAFFTGDEKPVEEKPEEKKDDKKEREDRRDGDKRRSRRDGRRSRRSSADRQDRQSRDTAAEERNEEKHPRRERSARRLEETPVEKEARENMEHTTRRRRSRRRPNATEAAQEPASTTVVTETAEQTVLQEAAMPTAEKIDKVEKAPVADPVDTIDTAVTTEGQEAVVTDAVEDHQAEDSDEQANETRRRRPRRRRRSKTANGEETAVSDIKTDDADSQSDRPVAEETTVSDSPVVEVERPSDTADEVKAETTTSEPVADLAVEPVKLKEEIAADSGLIQIETSVPTQPSDYHDTTPLGRPRTVREEAQDEGPLVQIETKVATEEPAREETAQPADPIAEVAQLISENLEKTERRSRRPRRNRHPKAEGVNTTLKPIAEVVAEIVAEPASPVEKMIAAVAKTEAMPGEAQETQTAADVAQAEMPETTPVVSAEPTPFAGLAVAEGLDDNLARAGLVQVHTNPALVDYNGYQFVRYTGRVIERRSVDDTEGVLEQVHTRAELVKPVDYSPVIYPGRPYVAPVRDESEGELIQVHTKTE